MNAVTGEWGDVFDTSIMGIHQVLLGDGRVLYWGDDENGNAFSNTQKYAIYDPVTGEHEVLEAAHVVRMFCGAGIIIPGTDNVLINGGNGSGSGGGQLFDASDDSLLREGFNEMHHERFYPTTISLSTGQILTIGGREGGSGVATPELFTLGQGWHRLEGATDPDVGANWWYPQAWVGNTGEVYYIAINSGSQNANRTNASQLTMMALDPSGDGSIREIGDVPIDMDATSPSAMFDIGRVVMMDAYGDLWIMDINGPSPTFTFAADLPTDRDNSDMVVLPDGRVLVNGGSIDGNSQDLNDALLDSYIFDPFTGEVSVMDAESVMRVYHSSSILLPDGTVMSSGGGGLNNTIDFQDAQIFQPDYLFNDDGSLADRPVITSAPSDVSPGETFTVNVDDASTIARMSFVKTGAITHSTNMESGRMDLDFTVLSNTQIEVTLPQNPHVVGAGNWMLFAIDEDGTPSVAPIIQIDPVFEPYNSQDGGLTAEYFVLDATVSSLDQIDFDAAPAMIDSVDKINNYTTNGSGFIGGPADNFAARYTGQFIVETAGSHTFHLTSDDGSVLFINGQLVINNDGVHASRERSQTVELDAGSHLIEVRYFERTGTAQVDLDWAGPGFDRQQMIFEAPDGTNIINGTTGDDLLLTTSEDDIVNGNGGRDEGRGSAGNDIYNFDAGYDQVNYDGFAADYAFIDNGDGSVTVEKPNGQDILNGVDGIWFYDEAAWFSIDSLFSGSNVINGTAGDDVLLTTAGDDIVNGNGGRDEGRGSAGNDTFNFDAGYDQVNYDGFAADYSFNQNEDGTVTVDKPNGQDTLTGVDGIWFFDEAAWYSIDTLTSSANQINGTTGDDLLFTTDADDIVNGNGGRDEGRGSAGNDIFNFDDGYDQVNYDGVATDYSFIDNGDGTVTVNKPNGQDILTGVDGIWFYGEEQWYSVESLASAANVINGTTGDDLLFTTSGDDIVNGNGGRDEVRGSAGNDVVNFGDGYAQVNYDGFASDYVFTRIDDDVVRVDKPDGSFDVLTGVDGLWFFGEEQWYSDDALTSGELV